MPPPHGDTLPAQPLGLTALTLNDVLTLTVATASLIIATASYFLNRRYIRRTFEAAEYPGLELRGSTFSSTTGSLVGMRDYYWLTYEVENSSKIEARNLNLKLILAHGLKRWCWSEPIDEELVAPHSRTSGHIEIPFDGLLELCGEKLVKNQTGQLDVPAGTKPPRVGIVIVLSWLPPIYKAKPLRYKYQARLCAAKSGQSGVPITWEPSSARVLGWRPITRRAKSLGRRD